MRSRRWGPTSTKDCSFLEPLNPNAQSGDMTTKVLLGRETLATSKHDAFLSSQVSAEASLREESTTPIALLFFERMQELLSLLRRYMKRWRRFAHEHNILASLEGIQRGPVIKQFLRMFYKWFLFCVSQRCCKKYGAFFNKGGVLEAGISLFETLADGC
ncbi:hypothetical protein TcCL_NonESM13243 [Trypanosoma cruzi]|nr:hypothetical protein TcCL_NonESM13243 [Trypanosoma cruzi]